MVMRSRRLVPLFVVVILACCFASPAALAQEKATIVGTVTDASGAPMPNVKVTITNTATSVSRIVQTNNTGNYSAPELLIGRYSVKAEQPGFKTYERTGIVLNVNDVVRVDIQMQLGEITETLTVVEEAVKVQSESGEVSDLISGTQVTQIAVNGRNLFNLTTLTTGVSHDLPDFNLPIPVGSDRTVSFNGLRVDHNVYIIGGGEIYDRGAGGNMSVMPSMDAIAEFKIMTSNYGADFGIGSGGTTVMAIKSGSNDFHGTAWEFLRNDALDATPFFTNKAGGAKPPLKYNTFGYNIGGPISKQKTFFFFNQEWRRIRSGAGNTIFVNAVPQSLRDGDFSSVGGIKVPDTDDPAARARFLAGGLTPGQPFPGNRIPASLIDPNAKAFLATGALPLPNAPGNIFSGSKSVPTNVREEIVRVDHQLSEKIGIMFHFINESILYDTPSTLWGGSSYQTLGTTFNNPSRAGVLKMTYTISPSLLNEAALNYNGNRIILTPTGIFARPGDLKVGEFFPTNAQNRLPTVRFKAPLNVAYDPAFEPWYNAADDTQVRDDVSWIRGKHSFKFGAQLMRYRKNQDVFGNTQGDYTFDGTFTGNSFADFLLGYAKSYTELAIQDRGYYRTTTLSSYATDSWRVSNRLTLNLGLRWEAIPHAYELSNRMSNFYPDLYKPDQAPRFNADGSLDTTGPGFRTVSGVPLSNVPFYLNGVGLAGKDSISRGLVNNYYNTFGPRVGFAYDLTGKSKTVLRGGFGLFYERIQGNDVYDLGPNPPFSFNPTVSNVYFTDPSVSVTNGQKAAVPIFPAGMTGLNREYKLPVSQQWSLGIQHELMPRAVLSVGYVGNQNYNQPIRRQLNTPFLTDPRRADVVAGALDRNRIRPFLGFSDIRVTDPATNSNYNSLQVNFRTENIHGLTFQTAYTWAHGIDIASNDLDVVTNTYDLRSDRASSNLDRRHVLTFNYVYDMPFFKSSQGAMKNVLGGWQLSGVTSFQTGVPVTVTVPGDPTGTGITIRPNLVGDPNTGAKTADQWFNPGAFSAPAPLSLGSAGRNIVRRPGRNNWNLSLFKVFSGIPVPGRKEGAQFQFRAEFFNAFNHTQFHDLVTDFNDPRFGAANSAYEPRTLQFGLKFVF